MRPLDFPLLADENIDSEVTAALAEQGRDIRTVFDEGLGGRDDRDVLRKAHRLGRVILTHDSDFGTLAIRQDEPYVGIIFLRPGHIRSAVVLDMLAATESAAAEVDAPFIVVAERKSGVIRVRIRSAS